MRCRGFRLSLLLVHAVAFVQNLVAQSWEMVPAGARQQCLALETVTGHWAGGQWCCRGLMPGSVHPGHDVSSSAPRITARGVSRRPTPASRSSAFFRGLCLRGGASKSVDDGIEHDSGQMQTSRSSSTHDDSMYEIQDTGPLSADQLAQVHALPLTELLPLCEACGITNLAKTRHKSAHQLAHELTLLDGTRREFLKEALTEIAATASTRQPPIAPRGSARRGHATQLKPKHPLRDAGGADVDKAGAGARDDSVEGTSVIVPRVRKVARMAQGGAAGMAGVVESSSSSGGSAQDGDEGWMPPEHSTALQEEQEDDGYEWWREVSEEVLGPGDKAEQDIVTCEGAADLNSNANNTRAEKHATRRPMNQHRRRGGAGHRGAEGRGKGGRVVCLDGSRQSVGDAYAPATDVKAGRVESTRSQRHGGSDRAAWPRFCQHARGCTNFPLYGEYWDRMPRFCLQHRHDHHINVRHACRHKYMGLDASGKRVVDVRNIAVVEDPSDAADAERLRKCFEAYHDCIDCGAKGWVDWYYDFPFWVKRLCVRDMLEFLTREQTGRPCMSPPPEFYDNTFRGLPLGPYATSGDEEWKRFEGTQEGLDARTNKDVRDAELLRRLYEQECEKAAAETPLERKAVVDEFLKRSREIQRAMGTAGAGSRAQQDTLRAPVLEAASGAVSRGSVSRVAEAPAPRKASGSRPQRQEESGSSEEMSPASRGSAKGQQAGGKLLESFSSTMTSS